MPQTRRPRGLGHRGSYFDRAVSGASLIRSGIQSVLSDAQAGRFDILLSGALEVRIMGSKSDLLSILVAAQGGKSAAIGLPNRGPKWRK